MSGADFTRTFRFVTYNKEASIIVSRRSFFTSAAAALAVGVASPFLGNAAGQERGPKRRVIDIHNHWYPPKWVDLIRNEAGANGGKIGRSPRGDITLELPGINATFQQSYIDVESRLKMMDQRGITMHAVSLTTPMVYWAPPAFALKLCQVFNDECSALHRAHPDRFVGLAMLPMQDQALAVGEFDRVAKLPGIRGIYMGTRVGAKNLDDKSLWSVYERCSAHDFPIVLHPTDPVGADRMQRYYLRNFLGNPYDTGIAAASLMFGGVLDAFPRLNIVLPHAGGAFPWLIGRMDHGATVRAEVKSLPKPPSAYLRRFYYDTIAHSSEILMDLIRLVGVDRMVAGTDYPADMSDANLVSTVDNLTSLSRADREAILGGNPARLLRL